MRFLIIFILIFPSVLSAESRIALVIGNANYKNLKNLNNPSNDAISIATQLQNFRFELINKKALINLSESELLNALKLFKRKGRKADIAFFYYAGHGVQIKGKSYILPVDVPKELTLISRRGIDLEEILNSLSSTGLTVAVFDACREILELAEADRGGIFGSKGEVRSIARTPATGKGDRLIAFSSASGRYAKDGQGKHSPYTQKLLKYLPKPCLEIGNLFRQVAYEMGGASNQRPEITTNAKPDTYYINPNCTQPPPITPPPSIGSIITDPFLKIKFVRVKKKCFLMGSHENEEHRNKNEGPQHKVCIKKDFWISQNEINQQLWEKFTYRNHSKFKGDNKPVERVSWEEIQGFLKTINGHTGKNYRLPSESEWEYAARADEKAGSFFTGKCISTNQANYDGYKKLFSFIYEFPGCKTMTGINLEETTEVGSYPANTWGIHDMAGNVWEWTQDCWNDNYEKTPIDGSAMLTGDCTKRVLRGGSWFSTSDQLRSAKRIWYFTDSKSDNAGFRIVINEDEYLQKL